MKMHIIKRGVVKNKYKKFNIDYDLYVVCV